LDGRDKIFFPHMKYIAITMFELLGDQSLKWSVFIRIVLRPRWNVLHVGSVSGCQGLGQNILLDTITTFPEVKGPVG
jgi:hypothetical protein